MRRRPLLLRLLVPGVVGLGLVTSGPLRADDAALAPPAVAPERATATTSGTDAREGGLLAGDSSTTTAQAGIGFYEELAKKEPKNATNHQQLAVAYVRLGRIDDARRAARRAIELVSDTAELHQTLGLVEEAGDRLEPALASFQKAASLAGNVEFRLDVARALARLDRRDEAEAAYAAIATAFAPPAYTGDVAADVQLALADSYRGLGRYDDAAAAYGRALELAESAAKKVAALVEKSGMLADRGDASGALNDLLRARDLTPDDADLHYNLGIVYVRARQLDAAVTSFDAALKLRQDFANAWNNKGIALERLGRIADAELAFRAALELEPRNKTALYNAGLVLFQQRKWKDAEATFEKVLAVDPEMADAKFFLGEIYFQLGATSKALRLYKDALRSNPDDGSAHRRIGDVHLQAGQLDLAVDEYWAAVDADKNAVDNRVQLMRVLLARNHGGDVRRAVKLGDEGLALNPDALDVRCALADAEMQNGRSPRARQLLEEGTARAPRDAQAHTALGRFFLEQGRIDDAQAAFRQAIGMDPHHAQAIAGDADAALTQGDNATALKQYEAALAIDPGLADARAELGYLQYKTDHNTDALATLLRATDDNPRLGKAWFYLAFAQFKAGQKDLVETSLERAVAVQPDLAEAWLQLGKLQVLNGKKDAARKSFLAAEKARGGTYEEARLELERLQ